ncbi:class I SAM-dependent methyltransferase [Patescibacteria group bacterium]|nr:class I SAM-dependent methyltransferase [Patescibacteria group bacterium]
MESFLNPEQVLEKLRLRDNMTAVDFGSGSGSWALPLAKKLKEGKIYAVDILEDPLSALRGKAALEKVTNIETIQVDLEKGLELPGECCDLVLINNLLFQAKNKKAILKEARRLLKKRGKVLMVGWLPKVALGPVNGRVSAERVKSLTKDLGLELKKEFEAGSYHWGLIFKKA